MADNVKSYMKNLGKSLAYSMKSTVVANMPAMSSTISSNSEIMRSGTTYVKNIINQKKSGTGLVNIMIGKYISDIQDIKKNAYDDFRSGKINNYERAASEQMKALGMDIDIDWGEDIDLDSLEDGSEPSGQEGISTNQAIRNSAQVSEVGSNFRTKALMERITDTSEASSDYIVRSNTKLQSILLGTQSQMHTEQVALISNSNKLLTSIFEFQNEQVVAHMDKQLSFYDNTLTELREIKEVMKSNSPPKSKSNTKLSPLEEIFGSDGSFDMKAYAKNVKTNVGDMISSSGLGMVGAMTAMSGGPLAMLKSNPLGLITDLIVSGMMPKVMKTSMKNLDSSLSGLFATMVMKFNEARDDFSKPGMSVIGNILGINSDTKTGVNVGKYIKDAVPYTGKTDKAITEVIPTLLSHILTAIKGGSDIPTYDYGTGKFKNTKTVIADVKERAQNAQNYAMMDIKKEMNKGMSKTKGGSSKTAQADLENFMNFLATSNYNFNPRKDKEYSSDIMSAGLKLDDPRMYNLLRASFMSMPKHVQSSANSKRLNAKTGINRSYAASEQDLFESGLSAAYSGLDTFYPGKTKQNKKSKSQLSFKTPVSKVATSHDAELETLLSQPFEAMQTTMAAFGGSDKGSTSSVKDTGFFKQLMAQKSMPKRIQMLRDKIGTPGQLITGMVGKLDTMIYRIIYGKEDKGDSDDEDGPGRKGSIIGQFSSIFKKSMGKAMDFMDSKVFMPFHEKFFGEEGVFTKLQEKMKPFIASLKGKAFDKSRKFVNYLLGEKKDGFYTGGALSEFGNAFIDTGKSVRSMFTGKDYTKSDGTVVKQDKENGINSYIKKYMHGIMDMVQVGLLGDKVEVMDETGNMTYVRKGDGILNSVISGLKDTVGSIKGLFSSKVDDMNPETKKAYVDWSKELKGFLPKGAASGLMGGAAGLFLPGGPILGAMMGTAIGFASHSKKFRTSLFGDEENEGVIPKKYVDMFKKFMPSAVGGSILGLIGSAVLPGGPLLGLTLGATLGFVKKSDEAKNFLFGNEELGKEGFIPKKYIEGYKKYFPTVMAGGLMGLIGSAVLPGGPLLGIAIGATLGYAQKSTKFQDYLFGKEADADGKGATKGLLGKEVKKNLGKIVGGGALGGILGMMGLPGGPILGMMVGASFGYYTRTQKFQDMIFGKKDPDTGEVKNSLKSKMKKFAPEIGTGFLGAVGILPGGLIGGVLLGSVIGYVTRSEQFKDMVFGKSKDKDGNDVSNIGVFVKKHFPAIAGGVLGAIGGLGFGIIPGILLGSVSGFAMKSDKFKEFIFGKDDKDGNLKGGILPFLKRNWKIPAAAILGSVGVIPGGVLGGILLGTAINFATKTNDIKHLIFGEKDADGNQIKKNIFQRIKSIAPSALGVIAATMGFIPGGPMMGLLVGSAFGLIKETNNMQNFLFGKSLDEDGKPKSNIIMALKKYTPLIAGGLIGTLATAGLGPIPGMAIGAVVGWATKTEAMQNLLFGKKDVDGNVIKKSLAKRLPGLIPSMAGTILGAVGIIPGGPLVGLLVGSAFGFIAKTGNLKDALFGKKDADGKTIQKSMLKKLPGMAPGIIGGLLGQFAGLGFGPITGIIVGSTISFVAQSQTMKELIFGKTVDGKKVKPNLYQRIKKALPMGLGGLVGLAIGGPQGVILGMLVGSAIQWVGRSSIFQNILFGKEDAEGKRDPKKGLMNVVKKALPMSLGLTVGSLFGPGGMIVGLLLGSVLGFSKKIGKFGELLFGKKDLTDKDSKRSGGLFNSIGGIFRKATTITSGSLKTSRKPSIMSNTISDNARKASVMAMNDINDTETTDGDETTTKIDKSGRKYTIRKDGSKSYTAKAATVVKPISKIAKIGGTIKSGASAVGNAFRNFGSMFKKFTSNTKQLSTMPKIIFMNRMLQGVKDDDSYKSTTLGLIHQIAVNTVGGVGGAGSAGSAPFDWAKLLGLGALGLAAAGIIKNLMTGDIAGAVKNAARFLGKRFTQLGFNVLKKIGKGIGKVARPISRLFKKGVSAVKGVGSRIGKKVGKLFSKSTGRVAGEVAENVAEAGAKKAGAKVATTQISKIGSKMIGNAASKAAQEAGEKAAAEMIAKGGTEKMALKASQTAIEKSLGKTVANKLSKKAAKELTENLAKESTEKIIKNSISKVAETGAKSIAETTSKEVAEKVGKTIATNSVSSIAKRGSKVAGEVVADVATSSKFGAKITALLTHPKLIKLFGKMGPTLAKHVPGIVKNIITKMAKAGAAIMAKVAMKLNLIVSLGFLIWDFTTGMAEAKNIFQLPSTSSPSLGMRIASGLGKMISGIIYGLIDAEFFAEFIYGLIGSDEDNMLLKEQQKQAQADLEAYNSYYGTTMDMNEYQDKANVTVFGKVANFFTGKKGLEAAPPPSAYDTTGGTSANNIQTLDPMAMMNSMASGNAFKTKIPAYGASTKKYLAPSNTNSINLMNNKKSSNNSLLNSTPKYDASVGGVFRSLFGGNSGDATISDKDKKNKYKYPSSKLTNIGDPYSPKGLNDNMKSDVEYQLQSQGIDMSNPANFINQGGVSYPKSADKDKNGMITADEHNAFIYGGKSKSDFLLGKTNKTNNDYKEVYSYVFDKSNKKADVTIEDLKMVEKIAKQYGIDPHLWWALVEHESGFNSKEIGAAQDSGWGQIIPSTGKWLWEDSLGMGKGTYVPSVTPFNKEANARMSMKYLSDMYKQYGNTQDVLWHYNGTGRARGEYASKVDAALYGNIGKHLDGTTTFTTGTGENTYNGSGSDNETTPKTGLAAFMAELGNKLTGGLASKFDFASFASKLAAGFGRADVFTGAFTSSSGDDESQRVENDQYKHRMKSDNPKLTGDVDGHDFFMTRLSALAKANSSNISITSGYRTDSEQSALIDEWYRKNPNYIRGTVAGDNARRAKVGDVGRSIHALGLAADIETPWVKSMSNSQLNRYGLFRPMADEPWHIQPIETQGYDGSNMDPLKTRFGTPFNPSGDRATFISSDFNNIGDPAPGSSKGSGIPDATDYSNKITNAVSSFKNGSSFNDDVLKILNIMAMSLNSLVSLSSDNVNILSEYIKALTGSKPSTTNTSVSIVPTTNINNNNPFTNRAPTSSALRQDKSSTMKAILAGSPT